MRTHTRSFGALALAAAAISAMTARTGVSDIYAATSTDGSMTFGNPVRVNDVPGDARTGGEYAPRVVIGDQIHVVWPSALHDKVALRVSRSSDDGKTLLQR
jgi:hypothetical protein